jgi:3-methyladenine DNA glycosylase/8-oxoguanine DNA glycosylase
MASTIRTIEVDSSIDIRETLGPLVHGAGDPTGKLAGHHEMWRASRTPDGPVALHVQARPAEAVIVATATGPGAGWALDHMPELIGGPDDRAAFAAHHPVVDELFRRHPGFRVCRSANVYETLVPTILGQRVTAQGAYDSWRHLAYTHGEPAPELENGPPLRLPPAPAVLASVPSWAYHRFNIERSRAETIISAAKRVVSLERAVGMTPADGQAHLMKFPGVGQWTAGIVGWAALGNPDAVPFGDLHLPNLVAYALAREPRANDERMAELLAPYGASDNRAGQRGRVVRLLMMSGITAPKYGPRQAHANIRSL